MKEHIFTNVNLILVDKIYKRRDEWLNVHRSREVQHIVNNIISRYLIEYRIRDYVVESWRHATNSVSAYYERLHNRRLLKSH
jgi:hypothetical protein